MTIDLKKIITEYPDCLQNSQKLKDVILNVYPQCSQGLVRVIVSFVEEKFVEEISSAKSVSKAMCSRWKKLLEDKYGYSQRLVEQAANLWSSAFNKKCPQFNLQDFTIKNGVLTKYKGNSSSVAIPNGVTIIDEYAFSDCTSLTSITIPNSVMRIGPDAFSGCTSLTSITIPDGVMRIDERTFRGCTSLTSITIPNSVMRIGPDAFSGCTSLTSITIPDGVMRIDERTFRGCTSLTDITIPESVREIGWMAFSECTSLSRINIPYGVTEIDKYTFEGCSSLWEITIPNRVTEIGEYAFAKCTSLTSITIPDSVTEIGPDVFGGCSRLEWVYFEDIYRWYLADREWGDPSEAISCNLLANSSVALKTLMQHNDRTWLRLPSPYRSNH